MSVVNNNLLLTADAGVEPSAYQISRSLRFNTPDSAYANRTFSTPTTQGTFTLAMWVKRSALSTAQSLFGVSTNHSFGFTTGNALNLTFGGTSALTTTAVFRDTSAWYHIVWTQSGTSHTVYVNGTSQGTATATSSVFNTAVAHQVGASNTTNYFNGYLADVHFIDGQALTPSSFTETNATTGQLVPKAYTGTYGTNGFRLNFSDNSAATAATLGADSSGNGNNWTPNNLSVNAGGQVSLSAASGALPVYNTTDTYGAVKGTGTRTDSNASSLVLAIPMDGANNGTTFTDESATIKGSGSAKSITRNGDTKTLTAQSKFYGSSGFFDATGDNLTFAASSDFAFGAGDFTIEFWMNSNDVSNATQRGLFQISSISGGLQASYVNSIVIGQGIGAGAGLTGGLGAYIDNVNFGVNTAVLSTGTWYHIALTRSGTNIRLFVNGNLHVSGTSSANLTCQNLVVGGYYNGSYLYNGYLQDFRIYKGVAKYTSNFTPPSATQNTTVAAGCDSLTDTPTSYGTDTGAGGEVRGNYATLNPLARLVGWNDATISNGNLDASAPGQNFGAVSTFELTSGKWYFETTITNLAGTTNVSVVGLVTNPYNATYLRAYAHTGQYYNGSSFSAYGATWTTGDIIGCAFDLDSNTIQFYKNGASQGQKTSIGLTGIKVSPAVYMWVAGSVFSLNFGQRPFAYAAPSGFKALCDTNLPTPTIAKGSSVFDATLYTGTGAALTPTSSLAFSPDLVWIKGRSGATDHALYDTVRGATLDLVSNSTAAQTTQAQGLTAFNSNGFSVGTLAKLNTSAATYAGWAWDAGSSTVTNTAGTITSQVRANASAGFSVVTYTLSASATVGHGLGVSPAMSIGKRRNSTGGDWYARFKAGSFDGYLILNNTSAGVLQSNSFSSTTVPAPYLSGSNENWVLYNFAPVTGYSSFGSYTGNGSADGPFVYLGFRPAFLMMKRTNSTGNWVMLDSKREGYNVDNDPLYANLTNAEATTDLADITSNGFKLRTTNADCNASGGTYIYAAFAENPFQFARAR